MRRLLFLILLFTQVALYGQTYKYLGVSDGLSNRRVYTIQQDQKGFMWFLTYEGIDRYDGTEFVHYKLYDGDQYLDSPLNFSWLFITPHNELYEIGRQGKVYRYDALKDRFELFYSLPNRSYNSPLVNTAYVDDNNRFWLATSDTLSIYNSESEKLLQVSDLLTKDIYSIEQVDSTHFYLGTKKGVNYATLQNGSLILRKELETDGHVNEMYYHEGLELLVIGTDLKGIVVYDVVNHQIEHVHTSFGNFSVNSIKLFSKNELLIATDGGGVYKMDLEDHTLSPYIVATYNSSNGMNGNYITDLHIDQDERIWLANFPMGVTIRYNNRTSYRWIKHAIGNNQSVVNDEVNAVLEDSDEDLWFATNNGVSLYESNNGRWSSFMTDFSINRRQNNIFLSICEVKPGVVWVSGFGAAIYEIQKKGKTVKKVDPTIYNADLISDRYVNLLFKDSVGDIWIGGNYNLQRVSYNDGLLKKYEDIPAVYTMLDRDEETLWLGTAKGLYILDKENGALSQLDLPSGITPIYSLYQDKDKNLFIGTSTSGLIIYYVANGDFSHYTVTNSSLVSNSIRTILSTCGKRLLLATEAGLSSFNLTQESFRNWTKDQGLQSTHFNPNSGIIRKNNDVVLGSAEGIIAFAKTCDFPENQSSKLVLHELRVLHKTITPNDSTKILDKPLDDIDQLTLKYSQNLFSIRLGTINYDYPSNVLYSWKLEGFYDEWSTPTTEKVLRFTNLSPGEYKLKLRVFTSEDKFNPMEERVLTIQIKKPFWLSPWAMALYLLLLIGMLLFIFRLILLRKERAVLNEKKRLFINTAHDIRVPLSLIKNPLKEIKENEALSKQGLDHLKTALRNVNALLVQTTNLINFDSSSVYPSKLYIGEYNIKRYTEQLVDQLQPYAELKNIALSYSCNCPTISIWLDKEKVDSVIKSILANAIQYTPENGAVSVTVTANSDLWKIEIEDTGIGIPKEEQSNLFSLYYRASNSSKSEAKGAGVGLPLVKKIVELHHGEVNIDSEVDKGTIVLLTFPRHKHNYPKAEILTDTGLEQYEDLVPPKKEFEEVLAVDPTQLPTLVASSTSKILLVDESEKHGNDLLELLGKDYEVKLALSGKQGLGLLPLFKPDLVITTSDLLDMSGDEFCLSIKQSFETSHIPLILLAEGGGERQKIKSLESGADEYLFKPFNPRILLATITNLLTNRALLRNKYANLELPEASVECANCVNDVDWQFITSVKEKVEEHMSEPAFNVDSLCSLLNMSRTSFYNKLKALTGETPSDYIRFIRLKNAANLLKEQRYTVTEIAEMVGFNDAKYFREVFKKHFHMSPTKYAKNND